MEDHQKTTMTRVLAPFTELFGLSRLVAMIVFTFVSLSVAFAIFWFFHSAPPRTITITSGYPGSTFETNAFKYRQILASNGVTLKIVSSRGSLENLQRLSDPKFAAEIGFVQSGMTNPPNGRKLFSLGSVSQQPLIIFYRGTNSLSLLSELKGKRLAIGPIGSGTHSLVIPLLALNGIESGGETILKDIEAEEAAKDLIDGNIDAIFLMGDSASPQLMRRLFQTQGIQIFNFAQADAYTRRLSYLNKLELPKGAIDFGRNIPDHDVMLIGPSVELIARTDLHPALIDLVLEAAQNVHGAAGIFKRKGEFPAAVEHDFPISDEADRFYKTGKSFLYRNLPFWLASVVNRVLVVFVPLLVLMIPSIRVLPSLLTLRIKLQIYRWYRGLLALERDLRQDSIPNRDELVERLNVIEKGVYRMKVPASFANQFYGLRSHIDLVRQKLTDQ